MGRARRGQSEGKKKLAWYTRYGAITIEEQRYRVGRSGAELRPFAVAAGVRSRDYSAPLQRVLVDFGAEESFGRAVEPVLAELRVRLEPAGVAEADAPVRRCLRYLANRRTQLGYQAALHAGLPIGSGEIESGHRSVIQERLKLSGAWWAEENARKMLALRVTRANGEWQAYWQQQAHTGACF